MTGKKVTSRGFGRASTAAALGDGFVAVLGGTIARVGPGGSPHAVTGFIGMTPSQVAVSPDQTTIAAYGHEGELRTVDARTGKRLGLAKRLGSVSGLAWTASNRLLVRTGSGASRPAPRQHSFDRRLRPLGTVAAGAGWKFGAVGEAGVSFDDARMRVSPLEGARTVLRELRLGAAQDVIMLSDKGFAAEGDGLAVDVEVTGATQEGESAGRDTGESTGILIPGMLGAGGIVAGALALALALALAFVRRRSGSWRALRSPGRRPGRLDEQLTAGTPRRRGPGRP